MSKLVQLPLHIPACTNRLGQSVHFMSHVPLTGSVQVSFAPQVDAQPPQWALS